ncbi:MAG: hypothetical protein B6D59_01185 [Campylobacteraceae bacterium 4484_4]|nr:MAG: hypothetical protein B6D59_01185 [Campylobacteraceae bacterium 4484_4]
MRYFEVVYLAGGKRDKTVITSNHKIEALKTFQEMGKGVLVSIQEINEPFSQKIEKLKNGIKSASLKKKVPLEPYIASLRQLGVMLDAGMPLNQSLNEVVNTTDQKQIKEIFHQIALDIEAGQSLTEAFEHFSYELGHISSAIISLGEQTGTLSESVLKLAFILEEVNENRKKLKKALRYPLIVILTMIAAFVAVIKMIVPQFREMFEDYGSELPLPTQILLGINEFIKEYGIFVLAGIVSVIAIHTLLYRGNPRYKYTMDRWLQKLYLFGRINHLSMTGRFMFVFNKLTNSGIPIIKALEIAKNVVENSYLKEQFATIGSAIEEGKPLTQGFEESGQFENMIIQMVKAGETSGTLNTMLEKVDAYYSAKYNDLVDNISTYIEPIMIFMIAAFLLLMALGIFLPMWSMADVVGN